MKAINHYKDRIGQKFGRLTILEYHPNNRKSSYLCKCDCDYGLCSQCCEIKPLTKAPQNMVYIEIEDSTHI